MKNLRIAMIPLAATVLFMLSACAGSAPILPELDVIRSDIAGSGDRVIPSKLRISEIKVSDLSINEELKTARYLVEVLADDGEAGHKMFMQVDYDWDDENKNWQLDRVSQADKDKWTVTPLSGVKEEMIRADMISSLRREQINIDGETWRFDEENLESITVDSRNTQLSDSKETINVTVLLNDVILVASGSFQLDYEYTESKGWRMTDYRSTELFTASERPDAVLEVSDDAVLAEVLGMRLPFTTNKSSRNPVTQQIIDITSDEVSGFQCDEVIITNKGIKREYFYSFNIDKGLVVFDASVIARYNYDRLSGWTRDDLDADLAVVSAYFEGTTWVGEHIFHPFTGTGTIPPPRPMTLEITDIASNGAAFATITFELSDRTMIHKLQGSFNQDELTFDLRFSEWISTQYTGLYRFSYEKSAVGYINIGEMSVKSNTRSSYQYHDFDLAYAPDGISEETGG